MNFNIKGHFDVNAIRFILIKKSRTPVLDRDEDRADLILEYNEGFYTHHTESESTFKDSRVSSIEIGVNVTLAHQLCSTEDLVDKYVEEQGATENDERND